MHLGSVCKKGFESNAVSVAIDCFRPSRSETEYLYSSRYEGSYVAGHLELVSVTGLVDGNILFLKRRVENSDEQCQ
jgi:hypothetical protein